jgi:hypothetical protein
MLGETCRSRTTSSLFVFFSHLRAAQLIGRFRQLQSWELKPRWSGYMPA